jgi:hypothetical protein
LAPKQGKPEDDQERRHQENEDSPNGGHDA